MPTNKRLTLRLYHSQNPSQYRLTTHLARDYDNCMTTPWPGRLAAQVDREDVGPEGDEAGHGHEGDEDQRDCHPIKPLRAILAEGHGVAGSHGGRAASHFAADRLAVDGGR